MITNPIAIGKNQILWVAEEITTGTPVWPTASDCIKITGDGSFKQPRSFLTNKEKSNVRLPGGQVAGPYQAGEFSFPTYIKPSGTLGVPPRESKLFKAHMGKETILPSTSVTYGMYGIDDIPITLSILFKSGFFTYMAIGCFVNTSPNNIKADTSDEGILGTTWSGQFLSLLRSGTDNLDGPINGTVTPVTEIPVKGTASKYSVGIKIKVGTNDGGGTGLEITAVNIETKTLTINPGVDDEQPDDATIDGWTPAITDTGNTVHGRYGMFQENIDGEGYINKTIQEAGIELQNGFSVDTSEKTGDAFPISILRGGEVSLNVNWKFYARKGEGRQFYDADNQIKYDLKIPAGNTPGKRVRFELKNVEIETPELSGDAERTMALKGKVFDPTGTNDVFQIVFD
jgi:hypothetical protein